MSPIFLTCRNFVDKKYEEKGKRILAKAATEGCLLRERGIKEEESTLPPPPPPQLLFK